MTVDLESLSAWSALGAAVIAIIALIIQSRQTAFTIKLSILMQKEEVYEGEKMLSVRRRAARLIIDKRFGPEIDEVLNFYEGIGMILRKGGLDPELVWNDLSTSAFAYWYANKDYIDKVQSKDVTYWENYGYLIKVLTRISRRKYKSMPAEPTEEELNQFFKDETTRSAITTKVSSTKNKLGHRGKS